MIVGRMYIYDSTVTRLPSSGQIGVNDLSSSTLTGCPVHAGGPVLDRVTCFDFILGTQYLYGSIPSFRATKLYDPDDHDAHALNQTIGKWTAFYAKHRVILTGKILHLQRPDGRSIEAVLHVADGEEDDRSVAILAMVYPGRSNASAISQRLRVPLYYTGLRPGTTVTVTPIISSTNHGVALKESTNHVLGGDEDAGFTDIVVNVTMAPHSYIAFAISSQR